MLTVSEKNESSAGSSTQDEKIRVVEEHTQRGVAPLVDGVEAGALDDCFDELFGGELAGLRLVRIGQVKELEPMVMIQSIGRKKGRGIIIGIFIRVWRIRKVMSAPL
jgi:hypothetical protein